MPDFFVEVSARINTFAGYAKRSAKRGLAGASGGFRLTFELRRRPIAAGCLDFSAMLSGSLNAEPFKLPKWWPPSASGFTQCDLLALEQRSRPMKESSTSYGKRGRQTRCLTSRARPFFWL